MKVEKDRDSIFTAIWKRGIVLCIQIPTILYLETPCMYIKSPNLTVICLFRKEDKALRNEAHTRRKAAHQRQYIGD